MRGRVRYLVRRRVSERRVVCNRRRFVLGQEIPSSSRASVRASLRAVQGRSSLFSCLRLLEKSWSGRGMELRTESGAQWGLQWMQWQVIVGVLLALLIVYEQVSYMAKGKRLPGPTIVMPFLGDALRMVKDPAQFWVDQAAIAGKVGVCWNVLLGRFILFIKDSDLSQKIFNNVRPDAFQLVGHPFGKKLFGESNLIFMFGEEHKDLRRRLAPNFTLKALGVYVSIQERIIRKHVASWVKLYESTGEPLKLRLLVRDLNLETSQATFVGPYLTDELRKQFQLDYQLFNSGVMALPLDFRGFAYHKARLAVPRLIDTLAKCAHLSKLRMAKGEEPACMADFWMVETLKEIREAEVAGLPPPPHSRDLEVGAHLFDFLFASQDASSSSLTWATVLLDSYPDILQKVRAEQERLRPDLMAPIDPELVREMEFTSMVMREVLRYRPPATLVPHVAKEDFALTDTYKIVKGTIVFPSVFESSFQGFTNPDVFDPDRFSPTRQEDVVHKRNWLVFGTGSHQCPGQRYALNHLIIFVAIFSTLVDWTRERTEGCDELAYTPTISPKDDGLIRLSARVQVS